MDVGLYRLVIGILGVLGGLCLVGIVYLSAIGRDASAGPLVAIASGAIGALVGLLTPGPPVPRAPDPAERGDGDNVGTAEVRR